MKQLSDTSINSIPQSIDIQNSDYSHYSITAQNIWRENSAHKNLILSISEDAKSGYFYLGYRQVKFKDRTKEGTNRRHDNSLAVGDREWTPHDLRRTGATMMQELGIDINIIDRCQNHVLAGSKVRRHYLKYEYKDEKAHAWAKLGERLQSILDSPIVNVK